MKKRNNLFYVVMMVFASLVFNVTDMKADVFYEVICEGESAVIGVLACVPDETYEWTGASCPVGTNNCSTVTVSPTETTTYYLEIFSPTNGPIGQHTYHVIVMEGVLLTVEDNLTDCMEKRMLTFNAGMLGEVPYEFSVPFVFTFTYIDGEGNSNKEVVISSDQHGQVCFQMKDVPISLMGGHSYIAQIDVEINLGGHKCYSDKLNIEVFELWISAVRDNQSLKWWKVVVGTPIYYSATGSSNCFNWLWTMPDGGNHWGLNGGDMQSGEMTIPYLDLALSNNDDFGDIHGTIKVQCNDGDGNSHEFYSTDMTPSVKVEVFFDKNKTLTGETADINNPDPPAWFVFWKDGEVIDGMSQFHYNGGSCEASTLGYHNAGIVYLCPSAASSSFILPQQPLTNSFTGQSYASIGANGDHLDCAALIMAHELHHKAIFDSWWSPLILFLHDDADKIPDEEEEVPGTFPPTGSNIFLSSEPTEENSFGLIYSGNSQDNEVRAFYIEQFPTYVPNTHPNKDWSNSAHNPNWN